MEASTEQAEYSQLHTLASLKIFATFVTQYPLRFPGVAAQNKRKTMQNWNCDIGRASL